MKTNRLNKVISTLAIAALILIGSAPCFDFAEDETETEVAPSATFDDSKVPGTNGGAVILMNAANGDVIYEKNAHQLREPASVTKIMTCLLAVENLDKEEVLTVPEDVESAGTSIDLIPGEELTVEQLLYGMMLESGNDAAQVLGLAVGGDLEHFSEMMNQRAKECGAQDTIYKNPNGLNENAKTLNVTTVYDQAVITRQALKNEDFRQVVSTKKYTIPKTNKSKARKLKNSNACLTAGNRTVPIGGKDVPLRYPGCTGVKTGFTTAAGGCYVGAAQRDEMELIVVSFGSMGVESKYIDAINLWNYGFDHYKNYTAMTQEEALTEQKVKGGDLSKVEVGLPEDLVITLDEDNKNGDLITTDMTLNEEEPEAPIKKGAVMGTVKAYDKDGTLIAARDLLALETVNVGGPLTKIGIADEHAWIFIAAIVLVILILIFLYLRWRKAHPRKKVQKPKREKSLELFMKEKTAAAKARKMEEEQFSEPTYEKEQETYYNEPTYYNGPAYYEEPTYVIPRFDEPPRREPPLRSESLRREPPMAQRREEASCHAQAEEKREYSPRGQRTAAEKRAIRKERAKKRKARMKERDDVRH